MEACNFIPFQCYVNRLSYSRADIESCNFVFASACLQDIAVCKFILPVYVYRLTCSRADMGVGECVCTLADIDITLYLPSLNHTPRCSQTQSLVLHFAFIAWVYLQVGLDTISVVWIDIVDLHVHIIPVYGQLLITHQFQWEQLLYMWALFFYQWVHSQYNHIVVCS